MAIPNQDALNERARNLGAFNGIRLALVRLNPAVNPTEALLTVHFLNNNEIANILAATGTPARARQTFPIAGGRRVVAGPLAGQVQTITVSGNAADNFMELTVKPIGDYSVYTLQIDHANIDPLFSSIRFKFRPGCFNADCSPDWRRAAPAPTDPRIDYLNKDYDAFRHTMIAAMMERVPGWRATSEADLDEVLIDLLSAAADELSDFQDRTVQEGYIGTARQRVSLARHARLMDYHIQQGNQASTWIALELAPAQQGLIAARDVSVRSGVTDQSPTSQTFVSGDPQNVDALLNRMGLYTWSDALPSLEKGATTADLKLAIGGQAAANTVTGLIRSGKVRRLLVQEWLNPSTGQPADRDKKKRQLLQLLDGNTGATTMQDPLTTEFFVRVNWRTEDALLVNYCFTVQCTPKVENVSQFHGNLLEVFQGEVRSIEFDDPQGSIAPGAFAYERDEQHGALCRLPPELLAYRDTPPGGDTPPLSTLYSSASSSAEWGEILVRTTSGTEIWREKPDLIHSDDSDEQGNHFVVETDELGNSVIRFGNGTNGKRLPDLARVLVHFQTAFGLDGNVGCDSITHIVSGPPLLGQASCWNPFDVTNGRAPEPVEKIIRRAPEMFRFRQLRAVTLADYVRRAEELPEVSRSSASYGWTGSWRTVRITIDPKGGVLLDDQLRRKLASYLDAVRLIGEDLELRPPIFVPLEIHVSLCVAPDFWPQDLRFIIEQEFSTGYTPDGRMAFFHPDAWTYGQTLFVSQILGRLQAIAGVEHILRITMKRWNDRTGTSAEVIPVQANEIILVNSDPDRMEEGFIDFDLQGGRR
jgi:hypothetical protein